MRPTARIPAPPRRWLRRSGPEPDDRTVAELVATLGLPDIVCRLLYARGLREPDAAKRFLRPRLDRLEDPFALAGMVAAADRLARAVRAGETVLVHGDYDVDGICATALYTRTIRALGGRADWFVPHRVDDGYDLGPAGLRAAARSGATLILTGDSGITAHDAADAARATGIDVIVTDHHAPGPELPAAAAVVNPNRPDCGYPNKALAGTGVAFKVCEALYATLGRDPDRLRYELDLVALATIADVVPLTGENRILVHYGLRVLARTRNPGLRALASTAGLGEGEPVGAGQVGYVLAPRLNAAGRLGHAGTAVRLLLSGSAEEARPLAEALEAENGRRRSVEAATLAAALDRLESCYDPDRDYAVVVDGAGWHAGVIGIVASRIVDRIHRPTVLIAWPEHGSGRGSARSIRGFHLHTALATCAAHLERFGGHSQAAGLEIRPDRLEPFREALNEHARVALSPADLHSPVEIDVDVPLGAASSELLRYLPYLGPFGAGNPTPVFAARQVRLAGRPRRLGADGRHVRVDLASNGRRLPAVGFDMAERVLRLGGGGPVDVAYQLQEDRRSGGVQAKLVDVRPSAG